MDTHWKSLVWLLVLCGVLLAGGLTALTPGARILASPNANTVNHYYNDVDNSAGYNILDDQSAGKGVYTRFTFPETTFYSASGTLNYTVTGKPSWLTWYATDRVFYGTPADKPGSPLQASYIITVTANDGASTDSLAFTLKIANVTDPGQFVPVFTGGDPAVEFYIRDEATYDTHLYPDIPIVATDGNNNIIGYRFVAPVGITIPFSITTDGTVFTASPLPPVGKYYYTVEAYDSTGYQDTAHLIINILPGSAVWGGATNSDWHTLANWAVSTSQPPDAHVVPTLRTSVFISSGTANQPTINARAFCKSLNIGVGVTLTMNADLTIVNQLTLLSNLNTGAATLTISGTSPSGSINSAGGYAEVIGNVRRTELVTNTAYAFGHWNTQLKFYGATAPTEATVTMVPATPAGDWACALARYYKVTVPGWTPGAADLRLRYTPSDGTCSPLKLYRAPAGTTTWTEVPGAVSGVSGGTSPGLYLSVTGLDNVSGDDFALGYALPPIRYAKPGGATSGYCDSWTNACALRAALSSASAGQELWVAAGTYTPSATGDRAATFQLKAGVAVYGGFAMTETLRTQRDPAAHVVTLSGDLGNNDSANFANNDENSYHVVTGATGATLDGVTIAGGNANDGASCPTACGGGMLNSSSSPTLTNVTFSGNSAPGNFGFGGGMYNFSSSPTLTSVTFSGNSAISGGGMANQASSPTLTNVTFSGNSASSFGGGMYNGGGGPTLTDVTFSGNTAGSGGGMLNNNGSSPIIRNSIFWGDAGGEIANESSTPTISDSVVQGGYAGGTHIIITDPLLGALGNYGGRTPTIPLWPGSSAIDGTSAHCPAIDQRGVARPQGAGCDIGAVESIGSSAAASISGNDLRLTWVLHPGITYQVWRSTTTPYFTPGGSGAEAPASITCTPAGGTMVCTDVNALILSAANYYVVRATDTASGAFDDLNRLGTFSYSMSIAP